MKKTLNLLFASVMVMGMSLSAHAEGYIILASTTSTENSGLFDSILPKFKNASGIDVRVVAVGTTTTRVLLCVCWRRQDPLPACH